MGVYIGPRVPRDRRGVGEGLEGEGVGVVCWHLKQGKWQCRKEKNHIYLLRGPIQPIAIV